MSSENSNLDWVKYAYVGMKVVCIDDDIDLSILPIGYRITGDGLDGLTKGEVYTIKSFDLVLGIPVVILNEIVRPKFQKTHPKDIFSGGYHVRRFKPLRSTKQGMETLNAILLTKPANQKSKQKDKETSLASILPGGAGRLYFSPASPTKGSRKS